MKRLLLWALLFCACPVLFAQNVRVTQNSYKKVAISFASENLEVGEVKVSQGVFSLVNIEDYGKSNNPGAPQLPQLTKLLQVPVCDSVVVKVVDATYKEYDAASLGIDHPLYPSQPSVSKSEPRPPFAYNQKIYSTDEFYSLPLVSVENCGIRRDVALANVYVSPVQYNPVAKKIRLYTKIDVEFTFVNADLMKTQKLEKNASPMFELDGGLLLNNKQNGAKNEYSGVPIKYLIIGNSMFASNTDLDAFVAWKQRLGYKVELAFTSDAAVGTTTTSIKSFIQGKYDNATAADPAPTFLLLLGDVAQLPAFTGQAASDHVTDLYYATLAGSDFLPDCYYGRLSATNNTELSNQIAKIMMYEQYTMQDPSYLGKAVLIAGTDGNGFSPTHADGQVNYIYNNYVNTTSTTHNFTTVYKHNYNCSSQAATIRSEINAGVGIANYTAHGSYEGWAEPEFSNSHVSSMTNNGKYGLLIGNCCESGKFNVSVCFGEQLLRAANKGAMGYIGASNSSYWDEDVYWAVGVRTSINANMSYDATKLGAYDKWFHTHGEAYSNWVSTIGGILQGGNLSVQSSSSSRKKYYWEIYHCFGDPSVRVYMGIPNTLTVSAEDIELGEDQYTVTTVPYAYVALKKNTTEFVAAAFANATGNATLTIPDNLEAGTYELVVLAQNYIWYHQNVEAVEMGSCLSPGNLTVANVSPFAANLSWTGEAGVYNIQLKAGNGSWTTVATNVTSTTYSLSGLQDDTDYQVRVQSVCGTETSSWRTKTFATPIACPVPTGLVCSGYTATTATLAWTENGDASNWVLQYGTNSSFAPGSYTELTLTNPSVVLSGLIAETTYHARVRANCGDTYGISQWSEAVSFKPSAVQTVEIGNGGTTNNNYLPSYNYYNYGISQQIYTPEEIGVAGTITSISFKNTGAEKTRTYSVYLQETNKQTFSSTSDWVSVSSGDLVFSGNVTFAADQWTKITFSTPYMYEGQSNLVVTMVDNTGSYSSSPHMACLVFSANSQALYNYTDDGAYDIASPGTAKNVLNVKNQIRMDILPAEGAVCPRPQGLAANNVTATAATLSWTQNGTASEWVLQYGTTANFAAGTYTEVTVSGTPTQSLSGLTAEAQYYTRVKAVCGTDDESAWSGVCSFLPSASTIIGTATATSNFLPTNNYYNYSLTQQIYTKAELGEAGDIISIGFFKNNAIQCNRNLDIYMVNTTKSSFSGTTDWITVTAANKVFSGTVNFANNDWTTITLQTPFSYDGTKNVAIIVDDNTGSYKSNTSFRTYSASNQALRICKDNTDFDPLSPSGNTGSVESAKNQIRILKNVPVLCPDPSDAFVTACDSYTWAGETFTASGQYTHTFTTPAGCDSVVTLHLTINPSYAVSVDQTVSGNELPFVWNGVTFTEAGIQSATLQALNGCDSLVSMTLSVCPNITLPYFEDFDSYTTITTAATGVEPTCWELVHEDVATPADKRPQLYRKASCAHSGYYSLILYNRGIYAMPALDESLEVPVSQIQLEMYVRQTKTQYMLQVGIWEDDGTFVPVATVNNSSTDVEHVVCSFAAYSGTGRRIAFRNILAEGYSSNNSPNYIDDISLTVACQPISVPYFEDFDSYTTSTNAVTGVEPTCWELVQRDVSMTSDKRPQLLYKASYAHSGSYSLRMYSRGVYAMPALDESLEVPVSQLQLEMYLRQPETQYMLQVGIWEDDGTFVPVDTVNNSSTRVEQVVCSFAAYSGNGRRIAFRNILAEGYSSKYSPNYIDDISLTVACQPISVPYFEDFDSYTTSTDVTTGVEPTCWELVQQDVSMSASNRPQLLYKASYAHSGGYSLRMYSRGVYAMPALAPNEVPVSQLQLEMYLRQPKTQYMLQVGIWEDDGTFVPVATVNNSSTHVEHVVCSFASYTGTGRRIAFRNILAEGYSTKYSPNYIDDLTLTTAVTEAAMLPPSAPNSSFLIPHSSLDNITLYPNPTSGLVHIDAPEVIKVECYTMLGQRVAVFIGNRHIDISHLPAGVYMFHITLPQGVIMRKVVRE